MFFYDYARSKKKILQQVSPKKPYKIKFSWMQLRQPKLYAEINIYTQNVRTKVGNKQGLKDGGKKVEGMLYCKSLSHFF